MPVGFVPKLLPDRLRYMIILKDFFDPCGFAWVSEDLGIVHDAYSSRNEPEGRRQAVRPLGSGA